MALRPDLPLPRRRCRPRGDGQVLGLGFFANKWDANNWWALYGPYIAYSITGITILGACIFFWHNPELGYQE